MGLLDNAGIARMKRLFDDNKDKIAEGVGKATDLIDDKTGGKYRDKLDKVDGAASKLVGADAATTATDAAGNADATTATDAAGNADATTATDAAANADPTPGADSAPD